MTVNLGEFSADVEVTAYTHDALDTALVSGRTSIAGPAIGHRGVELTVALEALGGAAAAVATIESLVAHVPGFAGDVLVACDLEDPSAVEQALQRARFRGRAIRVRAGGRVAARNALLEAAETEWILFVAPGHEFTADPLARIQLELTQLGCHFLNLAVGSAGGSAVEVTRACLRVTAAGDGLAVAAVPARTAGEGSPASASPFLSTAIDGDAFVANRETLLRLGGLDEQLSCGVEDLDLSLRVFRAGLKVGNSGEVALSRSRAAERRVAAEFARSAALFSDRYGLAVVRPDDLVDSLGDGGVRSAERRRSGSLPRVALITDTDSWAFANIARQLVRYLSDRFDFTTIPLNAMDNVDQVLLAAGECDVVHFFWRDILRLVGSAHSRAWTQRLGMPYERFEERFVRGRVITTAVYDHLFLTDPEIQERVSLFRDRVAAYYVSSNKLDRIYRGIAQYPAPAAVLEDGVDLTLFRPTRLDRFDTIATREVVVGWAGNSNWADGVDDHKGLHTVIRPALEQLAAEGYRFKPVFADRAQRFVPQREMPAYYAGIDVYLCASRIEGTPNPVLESMACGVPVVSTDVGVVPDAFGPEQSRFILAERSVEAMKDALRRLVAEPALFRRLSSENLSRVVEWDWSRKSQGFATFFEDALGAKRRVAPGRVADSA